MTEEEFSEVVENYSSFVYNVAYRMMGNFHDAEEVAQDAFISAYKARDRFRGDALPTTWLYRITVNAALMRIRKDKRGREMTVSEDFRPDVASSNWAESPVAATMNSELGSRIDDAIGKLPEDSRIAVILRDVQGLSNQEAADALDVSVSALKARLHRGRLALRDSLAPYIAERASSG